MLVGPHSGGRKYREAIRGSAFIEPRTVTAGATEQNIKGFSRCWRTHAEIIGISSPPWPLPSSQISSLYTTAMFDEDKPAGFSRRSLVTAASLVPLTGISPAAPAAESVFSPTEMRLIEAVVDRLIPSDELGPGARESGVPTYIERSLAGPLARERAAFTTGLAAIDAVAHNRHSVAFVDLDDEKKDDLLAAMESNQADGFTPDSRTYFNRIRQLTLEGMFGDPFYGGNRGFAGWDLIRYPGPRMAVAPADQRMRESVKPLRNSAHGGRHGG